MNGAMITLRRIEARLEFLPKIAPDWPKLSVASRYGAGRFSRSIAIWRRLNKQLIVLQS
jgi:hypothetical protein